MILVTVLLAGCSDNKTADEAALRKELKRADSLRLAWKGKEGLQAMQNLRPKLTGNKLLLCAWYSQMSQRFSDSIKPKTAYADSAIAFFNNKQKISKYPDDYYQAILSRGEVCLITGKYVTALDCFDQAKKVLPQTTICDDGYLNTRIAVIYYGQKNFKLAARAWLESFYKLAKCPGNYSPDILFLYRQGSLDNAAVSYQQAGMLDSAKYLYGQDLQLISTSVKTLKPDQSKINTSLEIVYDNIGGLYLKLGNFTAARSYLTKCLALPVPETDGLHIPPLIKLAELDLKTGNLAAAYQSFSHSKKLLNKYRNDNLDSDISWKRLYAAYLTKTGKPDSAYYYLDQYIVQKETQDKNSIVLYRLNVQRELDAIQQQRSLTELSQQEKVRRLYLKAIAIIAVLSLVIIYLVYRNLKKARRNNVTITLQNQHLQQTLSELERVNQNYIRIMRIMAHDLRNPLSGMIGLATVLLSEEEHNEESKHMLRLIESTGMHSIEMINELLKTGLADKNEPIVKQYIDIQALVYDSVELLNFKAKEKDQQIIFEAGTPLMVKLNHEKMWRVFNNLLVNAIKFSHEGGIIRVDLKAGKNSVTVSIADSGIGIPPENKDSVFEMFTPAKKVGTNGEQPFGLGLSISKRIIDMHGGKIWFDSVVGQGTVFYVTLPLS